MLLKAKTCIKRARLAKECANTADAMKLEDVLSRGRELLDHLKAYLEWGIWQMLRQKQVRREDDVVTSEGLEELRWVSRYGKQDKIRIETYWRRQKISSLDRMAGLYFVLALFGGSTGVHDLNDMIKPRSPLVPELEAFLLLFQNNCELIGLRRRQPPDTPTRLTYHVLLIWGRQPPDPQSECGEKRL